MWYGKGPGVDRCGDVFKHGNAAGTARHGGVLALAADDHACRSSTLPHGSEDEFVSAMMPVLNPAGVQDILDLGLVGWAMSRYRDEALVMDALRMALARRDLPPSSDLIQHTDRGSQYTADDYLALLKAHGLQVSMSGKADPYDNAMMESFFSTLRAELTDLERFATRQAARTAVFEFIEVFYNRQRLHSSLGYRSPLAYEADYLS